MVSYNLRYFNTAMEKINVVTLDKRLYLCYNSTQDRGAPAKSNVVKRLPKPHGKGKGAEADTVAGIRLAVRRISVLLSHSCGELS